MGFRNQRFGPGESRFRGSIAGRARGIARDGVRQRIAAKYRSTDAERNTRRPVEFRLRSADRPERLRVVVGRRFELEEAVAGVARDVDISARIERYAAGLV